MKLPLIVIAVFINGAYSSSISRYVRRICGGENNCIAEKNSTLPKESCCQPCECDHICLEKRTCCEDSGFSLNATQNIKMQKCLPCVKSNTFVDDGRYFNKYYTRATCPVTYADNQIRYKCESNEPEDLEDIPFVSSSDGKIVYKNRHCAVCHGEKEFISWDLEIDMLCIKQIFTSEGGNSVLANASYIKNKLVNVCSISFQRPSITDLRYTICHEEQDLVSTCEQNNFPPDNIATEIEELCLNDNTALTFFHNFASGKGYNNVYCYLCNNKDAAVTCDLEHIEKTSKSLIFLLNVEPLTETDTEDGKQGKELCGNAEVYDTFFGICRRIFCPPFEFPRRGECTSLVLSRKLNYGFNFEVFQISKRFWKPGEFLHFLQTFHKSLLRKLGLGRCPVCGFWYKLGHQNTTNTFYLHVVVTTTDECKFDLVLSVAARLEKKIRSNQKLTSVIQNVEILLKYIWSSEEYNKLTAHTGAILSRNTMSCRTFSPARFENCPKVALTVDECNSFADKCTIEEYETARNQQGEFEICYADYKELVNKMTSNVEERTLSHTISIAGLVLTLLSIS